MDGGMQCAVTTSTRSKEIYLCGAGGNHSGSPAPSPSVDASASVRARAVRSVTEEEEERGGCRSSPSRSDAAFARSLGRSVGRWACLISRTCVQQIRPANE